MSCCVRKLFIREPYLRKLTVCQSDLLTGALTPVVMPPTPTSPGTGGTILLLGV